jgi:hypothetical protein
MKTRADAEGALFSRFLAVPAPMSSVTDESNDLERTFKAVWYTDQAILALKLRTAELVTRRRELAQKLIQVPSASAPEMDAGQGPVGPDS